MEGPQIELQCSRWPGPDRLDVTLMDMGKTPTYVLRMPPEDTFLISSCASLSHLCSLSEPQLVGRIYEKVDARGYRAL